MKANSFSPAAPNSSTVGMIPVVLGGGMSAITGIHGLAIDNLVAVRIATPHQGLVVASETENADLFWALKGAGQFFGVVTEMTLKIHPLSTLGREDGKMWTWGFFYSPKQADDVDKAVCYVANNSTRVTGGAAVIMAPPPKFDVSFLYKTLGSQLITCLANDYGDRLLLWARRRCSPHVRATSRPESS